MLNYTDQSRRILQRAKNENSMHALMEQFHLRATRQRLILAAHLFEGTNRLIDAESLYEDIAFSGAGISLATIYNTLHHFAKAGLIRPVACHGQKQYYVVNRQNSSFFHYESGEVTMVENATPKIHMLPEPPDGYVISHIDIAIHLKKLAPHKCARCRLCEADKEEDKMLNDQPSGV